MSGADYSQLRAWHERITLEIKAEGAEQKIDRIERARDLLAAIGDAHMRAGCIWPYTGCVWRESLRGKK